MRKIVRNVIAILLSVTGLILLVLPSKGAQAYSNQGDFVMDGSTLVEYTGHQADLTLPDSIKTIGKDAFSENVSLRSVVIPSSVKTIDYAAFENCTNLQAVYIPESVRTIGSSAFSGCSSLYDISIPRKVESIGSGAFAGCTSLSGVQISDANPNFICQDGVIYSADGKEVIQYLAGRPSSTYTFPNSINKIREYAFWGASNLTGVSISPNVTEIPEYAFSNCPGLSSVIIPNSVTNIRAYSFADCINLRSVIIPRSVGYIDDLAFYMSNGVDVQFVDSTTGMNTVPSASIDTSSDGAGADNTSADVSDPRYTSYDENDGYDYLNDNNFISYSDYENNVTPGEIGSTKVVGSKAVFLIDPTMTVKESYNLNDAEIEDSISGNVKTTHKEDEYSIIRSVLDAYNGNEADVKVPEDVMRIGNRAFYKNPNINSVNMPSSVTSIGDFAFARSNISNVNIPGSVKSIGYAAFYQCPNLTEVNIPESVEYIELGAFLGTPYLSNWQQTDDSDNYLMVGDKILLSYKGEGGNISIPEGTKVIAPGCFLGNTSITGVSIPGSVITIGEDAFNGCSSLNTISLSNGIENIEDRAFKNTALSTLSIPPSVKSIGLGAFDILDEAPLETVLFLGGELPNVSYKPTASRLSASELRTIAFDGIDNAIIRDTADVNSGNLFDSNQLGFRGAVFTLNGSSDNSGSTLNLIKCNKEPDENGVVDINSHVNIGTTEYLMSGVLEGAFNDYKNISSWTDKELTDVQIAGNPSSELNSLLDGISQSQAVIYDENNAITVNDNRRDKTTGALSAVIPGNTEHYILNINDSNENREKFSSAFYNALGQVINGPLISYDISMTDSTQSIPITKLNKSKVEITMPVPESLKGSNDLIVVSLNDNGALETIATAPVNDGNGESVKFVTGHFSDFGICHASSLYAVNFSSDENKDNNDNAVSEDDADIVSSEVTEAQNIFNMNVVSGSLNKNGFIITPIKILSLIMILSGIGLFTANLIRRKNNKMK